ncbi:MAG: heavy metal transport/detoxification protein [Segetibacter sp.]|nr:heavy metal transport/detoxification protein [Segetibacter sp.]
MKKLLVLAFSAIVISFSSDAQLKKPEWTVIKTPNVKCWECKKRLEDYMAREISQNQSGIIKMQINMLSGTTRVQFWPDRTNLGYIKTAFNNAGFDADDEKATEDSYKLLPPACKRVEEGGGPQKGKPCHMQPQ